MTGLRAPALRRSWLFVGGADRAALIAAADNGADVLIHELEDFTAPALRPKARGIIAGVRISPLAGDGRDDLPAAMRGDSDVVMLPKVAQPGHVANLEEAVIRHERDLGLRPGSTELVPNIELARRLIQTYDICQAGPRVTAALVASEDVAADLGAERSRDGEELKYVRARFHIDCVAAGVVSIDAPYTWTDGEGAEGEARYARRLGYSPRARSTQPMSRSSIGC